MSGFTPASLQRRINALAGELSELRRELARAPYASLQADDLARRIRANEQETRELWAELRHARNAAGVLLERRPEDDARPERYTLPTEPTGPTGPTRPTQPTDALAPQRPLYVPRAGADAPRRNWRAMLGRGGV